MRKLIAGLVVLLSSYAHAGTLTYSDDIEILAVNGVRADKVDAVQLRPGKNIIQIRYAEIFGDEYSDSVSWYRSKPAFVSFDVESGDIYHLDVPQYISREDAEQFDIEPDVSLTKVDGDKKEVNVVSVVELVNTIYLSLI
ncbi:DUF2057 family protein [Shewanella sp. GXUN23E]|uniref:DUF2057 family protein n=1 Tax=Shewanella sp. GXUN23E TaxID=3422498 RepID=UPI003D7D1140